MPLDRISKSQFKATALEVLRQVEATGAPMVITDNGRPTVELRRYRIDKRSPLDRLRGSAVAYTEPFEPATQPSNWEALS